ncbi:hypothetical protein ACFQ5D_23590 [Paenibacillus farraposensis]|uniref:Uncharacterized protein n=1 Tax=Paenibacillus farraposensis TaxID=2807095 RepID=A0ABW4DHS5_9BACL|nr:hypothetical protein [Paenibacillus farraposensis]MCC3378024.1 hypothetical protein [Paenibacillus farraposensis]
MKHPNQDQAARLQQNCAEGEIKMASTEQIMQSAQQGMFKYRRTLDKLAKN